MAKLEVKVTDYPPAVRQFSEQRGDAYSVRLSHGVCEDFKSFCSGVNNLTEDMVQQVGTVEQELAPLRRDEDSGHFSLGMVMAAGPPDWILWFGGPAAIGAFLKYALDKLIKWESLTKHAYVDIRIGGNRVTVKGRGDLEQAIKAAERLALLGQATKEVERSALQVESGGDDQSAEPDRTRIRRNRKKEP